MSSIGISFGKTFTAVSGNLSANWLVQPNMPSQSDLDDFLTGDGINVGGVYIVGGSYSRSTSGKTALGVGLYTPQVGASYNYTPSTDGFNVNTNIKW